MCLRRLSGFGIRRSTDLRHIAYWSAAAQAARFTQQFVPPNPSVARSLPFVAARVDIYKHLKSLGVLAQSGQRANSDNPSDKGPWLPSSVKEFSDFYAGISGDFYAGVSGIKLQRCITAVVEDAKDADEWLTATKLEKMRLLDLRGRGPSVFLSAIPNSAATVITDRDWLFAARFYLGLPPDPFCTHCGACGFRFARDNSDQATHYMCCVKYRRLTVTMRHDALGQHGCVLGRRAGVAAAWEPPPDSGARDRPDGVFHFVGDTLYTDTTVRHAYTPSAMKVVNFKPGAVLESAVKGKKKHYCPFAKENGGRFAALAISTHGRFHEDFLIFIKKLSWEALNNGVVLSEKQRRRFLIQAVAELSIILQRQNAKILYRCVLNSRSYSHGYRYRRGQRRRT